MLSLTVITTAISSSNNANAFLNQGNPDPFGDNAFQEEPLNPARERETIVTQDIPVRILSADSVEGIHEPRVREPDAYIVLPSLIQLKAISDRFTKLALATATGSTRVSPSGANAPKLELSANMHGTMKLSIATDALNIESVWRGLSNPDLDPNQVEEAMLEDHPSNKLREEGPDAFANVRIDGKDWGKVLSVGRLGGRVIACESCIWRERTVLMSLGFVNGLALILYVYLDSHGDADESVLTVSDLQSLGND